MPARFTSLSNQLEKGLETVKPDAGAKQAAYWAEQLKDVDVSGVKGLAHDLENLQKKLEAAEPDGEAVKTLLGKIAGETDRIAGRVDDEKVSAKLKEVAEKLKPFAG